MKFKSLAFLSVVLFFACFLTVSAKETSLIAIDGSVFYNDGTTLVPNGWKVDVINNTQGLRQYSITGDAGPGRYSVTFIDISGGIVAATGDEIEIVITDADGNPVQIIDKDGNKQDSLIYILTDADIDANYVTIDVVTAVSITGSINGTIIDLTGTPLRALVIAINSETKEKDKTVTDVDGYYEILNLEPGIYWVLCIKKGYKLGIKKAEVVAGQPTTVDFQLIPK